jgi:DNA-binding transcriptional MerR regulator
MRYLTTLAVARELKVSKQTLLNWLYAGKLPEPPRDRKGYRLWSPSRLKLVKKLISDGRLHRRTVMQLHAAPELLGDYAREVQQFLKDSGIDAATFVRELQRLSPEFKGGLRKQRR